MANFTRRAIKEAFTSLLEERPLNDITVKDIVERCGINRNSCGRCCGADSARNALCADVYGRSWSGG